MNQNNSRENKTGVWRRLLSVVLAVCMVISMTPTVMAEDIPVVTTAPSELPAAEEIMPSGPAPEVTTPSETQPDPSAAETTSAVPETTPAVSEATSAVPETSSSENPQVQLINQLISELPAEVTEENAEEARARLQDILDLYSQLSPAEQNEVDITLCLVLQAQLNEADSAATLAGGADEASATLVTESDTRWENGYFKVVGDVTISNDVVVYGNVTLILGEGCTLTVNGSIIVKMDNSFTINAAGDGSGTLNVTAPSDYGVKYNAAIGSIERGTCGNITINGGNINATSKYAAGIGGGWCGGFVQTITITGGTVNAQSETGAGIGGGYGSSSGTVIITGGTVNARSEDGAGIGTGQEGESGTFSTIKDGVPGNAWIVASSISDKSGKDNGTWSGVIFEGDSGTVYGKQTLTESLTINANQTFTINEGSRLTIPAGVILTNNGTITNNGTLAIKYGGSITGCSIIGEGIFTTENLTEDMIILPDNLVYYGSGTRNAFLEAITYAPVNICGKEFTADTSAWNIDAEQADDVTYSVSFTCMETVIQMEKTVTLLQSATEIGSIETSLNGVATSDFGYSDTITVTAIPTPTGEAPAMAVSTFSLTEPTALQMALYYNGAQVSEPAGADANGLYIMSVPVSELINVGAGYDTPVTLSVKFIGDENMGDAEATVVVTLHNELTVKAVEIADKAYDGNTDVAVAGVTFTDHNGDVIVLGEADYTAAAVFDTPDVGTGKTVTVTIALAEGSNYALTNGEFSTTGNITPRTLTEEDITVTLDNDTYTWAGEEIKPIPTLTWNNNGTDVTIDPSEYEVSYGNNGGEGQSFGFDKTPYVCITVKEGGNYSFDSILEYFTITCNHNSGFTNGSCTGCGKQADVEVTDGRTSQGYIGTTEAPIDAARLEEIVKNADALSKSSGNPVTVKLHSGWDVPKFNLSTNGKLNFIADSFVEFIAGSMSVESDSAELTIDAAGGSFGDAILNGDSSKLTINSGSTANVNLNDSSEFIMNGGTVRRNIFFYSADAKATITGGEVKEEIVASPGTDLTITGGTIGTLRYKEAGTVTNTKLSGGSFTTITMPEGEQVGSILAPGYAFFNAADNTEITDTTVSSLSNVFVAKAGSHVISADLDFTGEVTNPGVLETDGYHWESAPNESGEDNKICTLTLKDCIIPGNIALPDDVESITIILQGDSSVGGFVSVKRPKYYDEYQYSQYKYNLIITGNGSLTIGGILGGSGADHNQITIDSGANVTVLGDVQYGASGSVNGVLTVNGSLTVNSQSYAAVSGGRLVIGEHGNLSVSGNAGVNLNGITVGYDKDFTDTFAIMNGGSFTADCKNYNIQVNVRTGLTQQQIDAVFNIPGYYIPDGYSVRCVSGGYGSVLTIVPESVIDADILNGVGTGGYLAIKPQQYTVTVALTSQLTGDSSGVTIGNLIGGGEYTSGDEVTVTAPAVDGCAFDGWYDGDALASPNLSYTFTAADDVALVAKYTANAKATVSITGANGAKFFVEGIATSQSIYDQYVAIGTKLKLTAEEPDRVSSWVNGSNKIIGTGASIEFTVTGSTSIKLMYKANDEGKAMVEFISDYGQLLSCQSYSSTETIIEPVAPSKLGYTFNGWNPAIEDIPGMIQEGTRHVTVKPVYTQSANSFKVTINYPDSTSEEVPGAEGEIVTITAKEIDGKVFAYWTDSNNKILSYDKDYFVRISSDVILTANYQDTAVEEVEPIIAITAKYASVVNGKNKVSFSATRSVPKGYTIVEHGILFGTDSGLAQDNALVLGGANVRKALSNDMSNNGVYIMNISVGAKTDTTVYIRGYMLVKNNQTNNIETIYSDIDSGSYNGLKIN